MLAVTEAASDTIMGLTTQGATPSQGGLRVAMVGQGGAPGSLELTLEPGPAAGDEVVTAATGAQIFLDPPAAAYLADKVLDVQRDDEGQIAFTLLEQD